MVMAVGETDWPLPLPLVRAEKGWRFDVERGEDEMLSRRIGRNELSALEVSRAIVDAQNEYVAGEGRGGYASRILSAPGQRDGLYWEVGTGETRSPLGLFVAQAQEEGYTAERAPGETGPRPFHGYYYRILTSQGPWAPGGEKSFHQGSRLTGYAVIAYPATYANSGVMTFMTDRHGVQYQADLGPDTVRIGRDTTAFDPDQRWTIIQ
jgi:hypothetical protein